MPMKPACRVYQQMLRCQLKKANGSLNSVAHRSGIPQAVLWSFRKGDKQITDDTARKLGDYLNISEPDTSGPTHELTTHILNLLDHAEAELEFIEKNIAAHDGSDPDAFAEIEQIRDQHVIPRIAALKKSLREIRPDLADE